MISVIDYGMGNLCSVLNAFKFWHADVVIVNSPDAIKRASKIVLPGVGSFRQAMNSLTQLGLISALHDAVLQDKKPILGICLGMQMMARTGIEGGLTKGLGWIEGEVEPLIQDPQSQLSIPHVGFNHVQLACTSEGTMFGNKNSALDYYFCHSYQLMTNDTNVISAKSRYGNEFVAAIRKDNIWGTQFHPEKSQSNGLLLIKRFIDWSLGND